MPASMKDLVNYNVRKGRVGIAPTWATMPRLGVSDFPVEFGIEKIIEAHGFSSCRSSYMLMTFARQAASLQLAPTDVNLWNSSTHD